MFDNVGGCIPSFVYWYGVWNKLKKAVRGACDKDLILCAIDARRNENADFASSFSPEDKHIMSALVGGTVMNHIGFDYN